MLDVTSDYLMAISTLILNWIPCRLKFGTISKPADALSSIRGVSHMELDIRDNQSIIFSTRGDIRLKNGEDVSILTASGTNFVDIGGFVQLDEDHLVIAESGDDCLLKFHRESQKVTNYAGQCSMRGLVDGIGSSARFGSPRIYRDKRLGYQQLIATDSWNHALRAVSTLDQNVSTIIQNAYFLTRPISLAWNPAKSNIIYIGCINFIISLDLGNPVLTIVRPMVTGGESSSTPHRYYDIIALSETVLIATHTFYSRVSLVDIQTSKVYSLCNETGDESKDDSQTNCVFRKPISMLLVHDQIYVGDYNGILQISGKSFLNPSSYSWSYFDHEHIVLEFLVLSRITYPQNVSCSET